MKEQHRPDSTRNDNGSVIRPLLKLIYPYGAVLTVVCYLVTLIWGFSLSGLLGFAIGYGYMCLCYEYLAASCERAIATKDSKRAAVIMRRCYFARFGGLMLLSCAGAYTGLADFIGIVLPQFFPRIILTFCHFTDGGKLFDKLFKK